jgi:hypothetical protein
MRADWDGKLHGGEWTAATVEALRASGLPDLVPADVAAFWPFYEGAEREARIQFWLMLVSAVARCESNFDPECVYEEPEPLNQKSIGLLQLSLTDRRYGCDFPDEESIKEAPRNLRGGVLIMDSLAGRAGRIGGDSAHRKSGLAAYWSTLRVPRPGHHDSRAYVISRTRSLPAP